jgi:hypothetical protein
VGIHAAPFARLVDSVMRIKGASEAPQVYLPQPLSGRSASELRAYIEGLDPVSGRPFMTEVIEGLTKSVEVAASVAAPRRPRLLLPGTEDALQRRFLDQGWTDKLPVILPTEQRVAAMLAGTSRAPEEIVGRFRPSMQEAWEFTVEQVAANAVMVGARPEYLPVILALASSGLSARTSSITAMASMAVLGGPIATEIGMSSGIGALGPYEHANATIGRAYGLLSLNLQGGSTPSLTYFGSQGNPGTYATACFAENEQHSPWEPFHVARGFDPAASAVTIFGSVRTTVFRYPIREQTWADGLRRALSALEFGVVPVLALDPLAAERFTALGPFDTRVAFAEWVSANALRPPHDFWETFEGQNQFRPRALLGEEPWAGRLAAASDEPIRLFAPEDVHILVVGGGTMGTYRVFGATPVVTVGIDAWR